MTDWLVEQRAPLAALSAVLVAAVAAAWVARERRGLLPGERAARIWVAHHSPPPRLRRALIAFVSLGRPRAACVTVGGLALAAAAAAGWRAGVLIVAAAAVVAPARALKARARYQTVPSGHVAYAVSLFGMAACVLLQQGFTAPAAVLAVAGLAMGPARILDGGHFLTDVVAGYAFGLAWLLMILLVGFTWASPV